MGRFLDKINTQRAAEGLPPKQYRSSARRCYCYRVNAWVDAGTDAEFHPCHEACQEAAGLEALLHGTTSRRLAREYNRALAIAREGG